MEGIKHGGRSAAARKWMPEDDAVLLDSYRAEGAKYCVEKLGRTMGSVTQRAFKLGLSSSHNPASHVCLWPRDDIGIDRAFMAWRYPVERAQLRWAA